jgi:hypothetical protein
MSTALYKIIIIIIIWVTRHIHTPKMFRQKEEIRRTLAATIVGMILVCPSLSFSFLSCISSLATNSFCRGSYMPFYRVKISRIIVGKIIVSCAGDSDLARGVYDHLNSKIKSAELVEDEIEIEIEGKITKKAVSDLLDSFVKSNDGLKSYSIIEFGNTFTIGIAIQPEKVGMYTCELCGYFTPYQEELYTHRMTHLGGFA